MSIAILKNLFMNSFLNNIYDLSNFRRCLDLVDTLVRLGEVRKLVNGVMNILHKPTNACPDVLLLALLQMQVCYFVKLNL